MTPEEALMAKFLGICFAVYLSFAGTDLTLQVLVPFWRDAVDTLLSLNGVRFLDIY